MRITKWGEYGILCSAYLATKHGTGGAASAAEIGEAQNIPLQYTQQILHRLRKGGVIKSLRGPHGGFILAKSPAETTLKDILYAAEGKTFELICDAHPLTPGVCDADSDCGLKHVWEELRDSIDALLNERNLASIDIKRDFRRQNLVALSGRTPRVDTPLN